MTRPPAKCAPKLSKISWSTFLPRSCCTVCTPLSEPASRCWHRPVSGLYVLSPLPFLDHLLVGHFDILRHAVTIPSHRVFGHALFVLGGQLVSDRLLHLFQAGPIPGSFFHRRNELRYITPEECQMGL